MAADEMSGHPLALSSQFGKEAAIYLAGFAAVGLIQFLALPIYARALGPEQYGSYSLALAIAGVLAGVAVLGGDTALARFWAEPATDQERRTVATTWIGLLTIWSIIVVGIACLVAVASSGRLGVAPDATQALVLAALGLIPAQLGRMLAQILRNTFQPRKYALTMVVTAALDVALALLLGVVLELGVAGILLGILIGESLGALLRLPMVWPYLTTQLSWQRIQPLLRFGLPLVPASLAAWVFRGADRVVLGWSVDVESVGYYGLAFSLVTPFTILTTSLGQAWIPRISQLHTDDAAAARGATSVGITTSLALLGIAAMAVGALAPWLVRIVGGSEFADSVEAVPFLAVGAAFSGAALFTGTGLTLMKRTGVIPLIAVCAAAVDIAALLLLIPPLGVLGASIATCLGFGTLALGSGIFAHRVYPLHLSMVRVVIITTTLLAQAWVCVWSPGSPAVALATVIGIAVALSTLWPWADRSSRGRGVAP